MTAAAQRLLNLRIPALRYRKERMPTIQSDGTALTLQGAGTYIVSGSCRDGSITVKKEPPTLPWS